MSRYDDYLEQLETALPHIEAAELRRRQKQDDPLLLVDVRQPEEAAAGTIAGAVNLPRPKLEANIEAAMDAPDQTVVVFCGGRGRSHLACQTLREMGIDAMVLKGGYGGWREGGAG